MTGGGDVFNRPKWPDSSTRVSLCSRWISSVRPGRNWFTRAFSIPWNRCADTLCALITICTVLIAGSGVATGHFSFQTLCGAMRWHDGYGHAMDTV